MSEPGLNAKVYTWAHSRLGQHVGGGDCWELADEALRRAGAVSSRTTGRQDDYVWGELVPLHQVMPGDILQFRNHVMVVTTTSSVTFDDGSGWDEPKEEIFRRPHHTAIVAAHEAPNSIVVLEQNVKPLGKRVQRHTIATTNSATAMETSYRTMKDQQGRIRQAKVVVSKTVQVSGQIWAYRPRAKQ